MEMGRVGDDPDCVLDAPKFGDVRTSQIVVEIKLFCNNDCFITQSEAYGTLL